MIKQVPTYAKNFKDLCTVKRGLNVNKKAFLTEQVSAIIQCKSPVKYKDPGCPTISVSIGGTCVEKALLDLGASVNLLPYYVYKQLGLGELKPTSITLSLADRSVKIPRGMIEDVLEDLIESFGDLDEGLPKPSDLLATLSPWRRRKEILPLFNEEETQRAAKEEPPKLILKPLPTELKYAYLEEDKKCLLLYLQLLPIIRRIVYLKSLEDADIIYPISDSPWVSPTQVVPKKSGITVVQNDKGEDVSTRLTTGWRVCIDYRKLNAVTRKDHFSLPFIDQENAFDLCNAPATFQRYMLSIFSDMVERIMEVFMDDITIYGSTFDECLVNLEAILNRCIEKDLVLNWKKCHFMVHQGIVLGHIISKEGIEVDKAKVELIVKLPSPTNVKGVRQFLAMSVL
ncbi:Retrovirus-related Pol polyprotein from transposon 297 [Vitis vinifera]|uniref:Retrovirus-related Pol polyprotein from transposon 297 n=1 Tax=Vitis vinifera TaxID=29760 RepID=A0A438F289_VITVI|nr:Retrovirus-related Pol polyprotein from transposon 297 [Vitis vinifera]